MHRPRLLGLLSLSLLAPLHAQDAERALLIVDPTNAESLHVANHYRAARDIPAGNVLYMDPAAANYPEQVAVQVDAFLGELRQRGIEDQVDFVVLSPTDAFYVNASGLVSDQCFPVNRFALPTAFTLARESTQVLDDGLNSTAPNQYKANTWVARAFQSTIPWLNGKEEDKPIAERYFLGTMLGWTGNLGTTRQDVLDMIDRSVAVDGTFPLGTAYYCQTNDVARSGPRHDTYPDAVAQMIAAGGAGQHLFANLPLGQTDAMGIMTGLANPDIANPTFALLAGSFADHLTSYAATFTTSSQTKMTRWIEKGASGTSGTVEEPCNYAGKFPHARLHVVYRKGLTLGESWFRSIGFKPFQVLFLGDPLTRPYGEFPLVDVPSPPTGPVSGTIAISPTATATSSGGAIDVLELWVDGRVVETIAPGGDFTLDTTTLADGWHELRVRAFDDKLVRNPGRWIGALETANHGKAVTLAPGVSSGDLGTPFDLAFAATGGTVDEVVLFGGGRVLAAAGAATDTLVVFGQNLGAGTTEVQVEARFDDGTRARSARVALDVAATGGGGSGTPPLAFDYTLEVRDDAAFVVALPAAFDEDPSTVTTTLTATPVQATLLGGSGPWRAFAPGIQSAGSDAVGYQVTTAGGTATGTVTLVYVDADGCPPIDTFCLGDPNSAGPGARLVPSGSVSVAANDLVFTVADGPPNQFGLIFYGDQQTSLPVGDGELCVGGKLWRLAATQLDGAGTVDVPLDITLPPNPNGQITVGSSWAFQYWYRDPGFGPAGFNFSDGLWVTFCD